MGLKGVDYDKLAEKRSEVRKRRSSLVNAKGRAGDRRQPGEVRSRGDAIKSFCSECITSYGLDTGDAGSVKATIEACFCTECHLWPWRNGPLDEDAGTR